MTVTRPVAEPRTVVGAAPRRRPPRWAGFGPGLLVAPAVALIATVFLWPVLSLVGRSVREPTPGLQHYRELAADPVVATVLTRTFGMATAVVVVTLLLGYPYAYVMSRVGRRTRAVMLTLVLLPFWTSIMARTFAWLVLLQDTGVINRTLAVVGVGPMPLARNAIGVTIGMTQVLLPFMVLPLYSTMSRIDLRLVAAAQSLGAHPRTAFRLVFLPLSLPGVVAGVTLVYILAIGFYITPRILGSPQEAMIAQLLALRVERLLDFPGAGALSAVLLAVTLLIVGAAALGVRRWAVAARGGEN